MITTTPEQSKRLKELGFPQDKSEYYYYLKNYNDVNGWRNVHAGYLEMVGGPGAGEFCLDDYSFSSKSYEMAAAPDLGDLIEWLGDDFQSLDRSFTVGGKWEAVSLRGQCFFAETPLDAVVALAEKVKGGKGE